jgi:staphylococcal nuclease domain-containing protein 1
VIDQVLSGATFTVWLLPNFEYITLQLAGIRCPSSKRSAPEPFTAAAKSFSESHFLNITVTVTLVSAADGAFFLGRAVHPVSDIAVFLLAKGFARLDASGSKLPNYDDLRDAEARARAARCNVWSDSALSLLEGRATLVRTSNCIEVDDGNVVHRVLLSGIRVPKFTTRTSLEQSPGKLTAELYGLETRERVRQLVLGRVVRCTIDYTLEDKVFATVVCGGVCVNETLCREGLATAAYNRHSEQIAAAEAEAKGKRIGLHSARSRQAIPVSDLANGANRQKSLSFLAGVQNRRVRGIIEKFVSATRIVVLLPDQHVLLRVNLLGVAASDSRERIGREALFYCETNYIQQDVDVILTEVDRIGFFMGNAVLLKGNKSLEAELLSRGFTKIHRQAAAQCQMRRQMEEAEKKAQELQIGVWSAPPFALSPGVFYECEVVGPLSPVDAALQMRSEELARINRSLQHATEHVTAVARGDLVAAISEGQIFRSRVVQVDRYVVAVELIDAADQDKVAMGDLRVLPDDIAAIPAQGIRVRLGGVAPFDGDDEFRGRAMDIWETCRNKVFHVQLMYEGDKPYVLLAERQVIEGGSVNLMLVADGFARVDRRNVGPQFDGLMRLLADAEADARAKRKEGWRDDGAK